ncbi:MAG TPA: glutathione transferase GstA [Alphaproteobacteria bacterium]|nr:glutathione transferase GstA [Alphaproteobacteria bacterium]
MKLYFSPGACSLSPHIALREAALPFELEQVDLKEKRTKSGADFRAINPKGYVPALALDNGELLTEGPAILQYLADRVPEKKLAPPAGSFERVRLQETLNFVTSELHKGLGSLFNPKNPDAWREVVKSILATRFAIVEKTLESKPYIMGAFSVADCYLFTILNWTKFLKLDLSPWPALPAYLGRMAERPAVQAALKAEGIG